MFGVVSRALGAKGAAAEPSSSPAAPAMLWRWAALSSGAIVLWAMLPSRGRSQRDSRGVFNTDFDSFLVKQAAVPTGLGQQRKAKGAKPSNRSASGPFENFLKDEPAGAADVDERDPADFSTFLKTSSAYKGAAPAAAAATAAAAVPDHVHERPTPDMARVLVLFGTEYGFSKEIAELLASKLKGTKAFWPTVVDMASRPEGLDFGKEQAVLVACSTQGDGVPPTEARDFCEWLFADKAGLLAHVHFSVCALGDRSYTHFCKCGSSIDAAFDKAGAKRCVPKQEVNKEDWNAVNAWIDAVLAALPTLGLKTLGEAGETLDSGLTDGGEQEGAQKRWGKSRPFPAAVVAIEGLCSISGSDDKNTMRVEIDLAGSGMAYQPGDALGIYPINSSEVVSDLLRACGLSGLTPVPVPSHHYEEDAHSKGGQMTLEQALAKCYDLRSPKPDIFKLLATLQQQRSSNGAANGNGHAAETNGNGYVVADGNGHTNGVNGTNGTHGAAPSASLAALQAGGDVAEAYLAARHVADVLRDFLPSGARLAVEQLLPVLRPLQPRLYSISSSPLENAERVQATIAEVKYSSLGLDRIGVCSTFVSERIAVGRKVHVFISKNPDFRLPADAATPILMVGPGTGLAPFRSFIQHRLLEQPSAAARGPMVLYFGCRRSDQDFLYGDVLQGWAQSGDITLFTAFSRQQAKKVYVQQRLRESADLVWQLLHDKRGHFYVCGDAASMAGAVEKELLQIFEEQLGAGPEAATKYLEQLSQEGRYQRDVWY